MVINYYSLTYVEKGDITVNVVFILFICVDKRVLTVFPELITLG